MRIDPKTTTITPVASKSVRTAGIKRDDSHDAAAVVELSRAGAAASSASVTAPSGHASEKVSRLRMQIEKGEYHPDLDLLARKIVEDDLVGDAGDAT